MGGIYPIHNNIKTILDAINFIKLYGKYEELISCALRHGWQGLGKNQGCLGLVLERMFGKKPDSSRERDFDGFELKASFSKETKYHPNGIIPQSKNISVIDFDDYKYNVKFEDSFLFHKIEQMLYITYKRFSEGIFIDKYGTFDIHQNKETYEKIEEDYYRIKEIPMSKYSTEAYPINYVSKVKGEKHGKEIFNFNFNSEFYYDSVEFKDV